jgi:hypothetical protein
MKEEKEQPQESSFVLLIKTLFYLGMFGVGLYFIFK